ncbi:MAG: hypothetical protein M3530_00120 [Thermoproteota archaeon]|nr:hypothetical protein [Thermoproteota archaeon]
MKTKQTGMFIILAISIATAISGTAAMSLATPVFAGGDDDGGQKCKKNDDNNCNKNIDKQKIYAKNECEIENNNKDHSDNNDNVNVLECVNPAANLDETALLNSTIFDVTD